MLRLVAQTGRADPDDPMALSALQKERRNIQESIETARRPGEVLALVDSASLPLQHWDGINLTNAVRRIARLLTSNTGHVDATQAATVMSDRRYASVANELYTRQHQLDSEGLDAVAWACDKLGDHTSAFATFARECRQQSQLLRDLLVEADSASDVLSATDGLELGVNDNTLARSLHGISSRCKRRREKREVLSEPGMRALVGNVYSNATFFKPGSLVLVLDSLSRLNATAPSSPIADDVRTASDALVDRASEIAHRFEPWHFPVLLAAIARLRLDCRCRSLSRIATLAKEHLNSLSGKEIAKLVGSLASIGSGYNPGDSFLHQAVAAFLELPEDAVASLPNATRRLVLSLRQLQYTPSQTLMDRFVDDLLDCLGQYTAADAGSILFAVGDTGHVAQTEQLAEIFNDLSKSIHSFACIDCISICAALWAHGVDELVGERGIYVQDNLKHNLGNKLLDSLRDNGDSIPDDPADLVMVPYAVSFIASMLTKKQVELVGSTLGPHMARCKPTVQTSFLRTLVRDAGLSEHHARSLMYEPQKSGVLKSEYTEQLAQEA